MQVVSDTGVERFAEARERLSGSQAAGRIADLRSTGMAYLRSLGFPGVKDEAWKYTPIAKALPTDISAASASDVEELNVDVARLRVPGLTGPIVVIIDGQVSRRLSNLDGLPTGLTIESLRQADLDVDGNPFESFLGQIADPEHQAFEALNTAFLSDGLLLRVRRGVEVATPIEVLSLTTGHHSLVQPRLLYVADEGSRLTIVENQQSLSTATDSSEAPSDAPSEVFSNVVCEVFAARDARVDHYRIQSEGPSAKQVCTTRIYQSGSSEVSTFTATFGGSLVRNNLHILPDAEHCETHLNGLFVAHGSQHVDNHTFVDHAQPNCESNELYKGILDGTATGVFNGKVLVRRDAQKTNAYQSNKSIVLSDTARMYAKPELEIYADDVKCSHGATTGQVEAEALFYLQSRGIPRDRAMRMLLGAFAGDVLALIAPDTVRSYVESLVDNSLTAINESRTNT